MDDNTTRPPEQRSDGLKSSLHIMEHSNAPSTEKIHFALLALYPEDKQVIEKVIVQTLKTLTQKT